jgi:hypothetical protein
MHKAWKIYQVVLISKDISKDVGIKNCRPISLESNLLKFMEKVVLNSMLKMNEIVAKSPANVGTSKSPPAI